MPELSTLAQKIYDLIEPFLPATGGGDAGNSWGLPYFIAPKLGNDAWELSFDEGVSTQADLAALGWTVVDGAGGVVPRDGEVQAGRSASLPPTGTYRSTVQGSQLIVQPAAGVYIYKAITDGGNWDLIVRARLSSYGDLTSPAWPSMGQASLAAAAWNGAGPQANSQMNLIEMGVFGNTYTVSQRDSNGTVINSGSSVLDPNSIVPDTFVVGVTPAFNTGTQYGNSAGTGAYIGSEGYAPRQINSQQVIGTFPASPIAAGGMHAGYIPGGAAPSYLLLHSIRRRAVSA